MAASSLGRLTLDLVAKIGNFTGPMTHAERQARNSSNNIADSFSIASVAATAFGAAVAGVSVGGMIAFANQTINMGNEIKKFSQLSNSSLKEFQYYSKGAETAGISMESFADKMKDMQDRIGDFQQTGGGPLADFFENIAPLVGVTIQQFQKLSGPQALQLYYDSLQKVGASQNDMKFYMEAIISDSSLLIPLLQNGGEGFKKWGDAAERANAIMSDEMIESLALAKENVQLLNLQWEGLKTTLINNVVPVVQAVADNMDNVKAVALALTAAIGTKLVVQGAILAGTFTMAAIRAGVMEASLMALQGRAAGTAASMGVLRGAMAFLGGPAGLAMLAVQGIATGAAFLYMKKSSDDVEPSLQKQGKSISELVTEYNDLSEAQQRAFKYQEAVELRELSEQYTKAQQQVRAYASSIAEVVAKDESTKNTIRGWIREFDQNAISAETLANRINKLGSVAEENKMHMDKHAVASTGVKKAMDAQQKVVDSLTTKSKTLARTNDAVTVSVNGQAQAWLNLNQKQRAALTDIKDSVLRSQYIDKNIAAGWSRDRAEYVADYRDQAGLGFTNKLTAVELKQLKTGFKVQEQTKAREESEKKIEEAKRKQLELSQKQYSYNNSELKMLQKVSEISSKYGLNEIGAKYGVPENLLAAVMAQESKGNINAKSSTGAIGPFQTTGIYRKQYGMSVADSYDVKKAADTAAKDLAKSFEVFGNWTDAVTAYNAGVGGTKSLKSKGFTESASKTKEAKEYAGLVNKWLVGLGGSSSKDAGFVANDAADNIKDWQEYWTDLEELRKQTIERQKTISQTYFTEDQRLAFENTEAKKEIEIAFAGDQSAIKKYSDLQNAAYQKDLKEYQEAQNLKTISEKKQLLESKSLWMSAGDYAEQYYALVREEILATSTYTPEAKDALVKQANMQQGMDQNAERENVWDDYKSMMGLDKSPYQQDMDLLAEAREQMLITEELYQQQRLGMQLKYGSQYGSDFAGMMMGLVDQSSSAYAILYSVQKGFNLASAIMNGYTAISAAWASAPFPYNLPAVAMATMETGVLQAAISAVSPVGMAHDGIDNIPKEGTWLLDGGERVLNPNQNKDLTNYLTQAQSNQSSSANVNLNPNFVIVDEREKLGDYLYGPDGKKAFVKFFKQNRRELGIA